MIFWLVAKWMGAAVLAGSMLTGASFVGAWLLDKALGPIERKSFYRDPWIDK
jgi:hypothetical protein